MAARTKRKVNLPYKTKYRVQNWPAYEAALRRRGDITVWFDEAAVAAWNAAPSGFPRGQQQDSDLAIIPALTLRTGFHLALRQTEGFVASLIRFMNLDLAAPDHTTLSRRNATVAIPAPAAVPTPTAHPRAPGPAAGGDGVPADSCAALGRLRVGLCRGQ